MDIRAAEISAVLKEQIANFGTEAEMAEVGRVLSVGDGIARVYGLDEVESGELVTFEDGTRGLALNLETDNVGIVISAKKNSTRGRSSGQSIVDLQSARRCSRVVDALGERTTEGPIQHRAPARRRQAPDHPGQSVTSDDDRTQGVEPDNGRRGQRELIIGDRQPAVAIPTMRHQPEGTTRRGGRRHPKLFCIYVAIGQSASPRAW